MAGESHTDYARDSALFTGAQRPPAAFERCPAASFSPGALSPLLQLVVAFVAMW